MSRYAIPLKVGDIFRYRKTVSRPMKYYKYTGSKRKPKRGELFISGAIPQVYLAEDDLPGIYAIPVEIPTPPEKIKKNGIYYRIDPMQFSQER